MNINQSINKLLYALQQKGKIYKINSFKFYSEKMEKYCIKFQILKMEVEDEEQKYYIDEECYSKIDVLKYLVNEHKGSEADVR